MADVARPQRRPVSRTTWVAVAAISHLLVPKYMLTVACQGPVSKACWRVALLSLCQSGDRPHGFGRPRPDAGGRKLCSDCSNDAASYPEDSFENMKRFAKAHDFPFPYLHDETQTVARAYGAVCTPDFFGYNADRKLKYRGRLDEGRTTPSRAGAPRGHARDCDHRCGAGGPKGVYWLLDQMEERIKPSPVLSASTMHFIPPYALPRQSREISASDIPGLLGRQME